MRTSRAVASQCAPHSLRVFPELRQAHIEELYGPAQRTTYFLNRKYDLVDEIPPNNYIQSSLSGICRHLWKSNAERLELPEPLWMRFLPSWFLLAFCWKLRCLRGITRSDIVTYGIENSPPERLFPFDRCSVPVFRTTLGRLIGRLLSRIAFGTSQSEALYRELIPLDRVTSTVIPDLLPARPRTQKRRGVAAFVGALEQRKGLDLLLVAWPMVESAMPGSKLLVMGDGPLRGQMERWVAESPGSREWMGSLPRAQVLDLLDTCEVLVAPSVPSGRWREQVGRPIQEALACGATVVTSDETGLSELLRAAGHFVLPASELADRLGETIVRALADPLPARAIHAPLPRLPGRVEADAWLHAS